MFRCKFIFIAVFFNHGFCLNDETANVGTSRYAPPASSAVTNIVQIKLIKPDNLEGEIINHHLVQLMDINKSGKTVVLFNGHPTEDSPIPFLHLSKALFNQGVQNIIFMFIDWTKHKMSFHDGLVLANSFGTYIANMLKKLNIQNKLYHFIGHCLGAEVAASAIRRLYKLAKKQTFDRFTVFDAYYTNTSLLTNLNDIVSFIDIYHAGIYSPVFPPVGSIDFYPNGGALQPGCDDLDSVDDKFQCNHRASIYFYIESMNVNVRAIETGFDYDNRFLLVKDNPKYVTFGYFVDYKAKGSFYIPTMSKSPHLFEYF